MSENWNRIQKYIYCEQTNEIVVNKDYVPIDELIFQEIDTKIISIAMPTKKSMKDASTEVDDSLGVE